MWFFRILKLSDGTWECRRGRTVIDEHLTYDDALAHICTLAANEPPSQVFVHGDGDAPPISVARFDT